MDTSPSIGGREVEPRAMIRAGAPPFVTVLIATAALLLWFLPETWQAALIWESQAPWRPWTWLTSHLMHWSFEHLFWDVLAFAVLGLWIERHSRRALTGCLLASALAIGLALALGLCNVTSYRGLSGIDSALFAWIVVRELRSEERLWRGAAAIGLVAFLAKLVYEITTGQALFVSDWAGDVRPLPEVHLLGAAVGMILSHGSCLRYPAPDTQVELPPCQSTADATNKPEA